MRAKWSKIISLFLSLVIALNIVGCSLFDRAGEKVADGILSDATATTSTSIFDPNGTILYEDVRLEDILEETTLQEVQLEEQLLSELMLEPELLEEGVKLESIRIEIIDCDEYLFDDLGCDSYYTSQLDYTLIHDRFAQGSSLVIAEVTFDVGSLVVDVVCANWVGAAIDAGQIVMTVGTTTLAAFISYHVAQAKSLAAGNSYEVALYDALDSASASFYYASVIVDAVNAVISLGQIVVGIVQAVKTLKVIIAGLRDAAVNASRTIVVTKTAEDSFEVVKNGRTIVCKLAADSPDLYDPATGRYICSLIKNSSGELEVVTKTIPSQVFNRNGDLIYRIDDVTHEVYKITQKTSGVVEETLIGIADEGGFIYNAAGKIVSRMDFSTGKIFTNAFTGLERIGLSTNVFGDIIDSTGNKVTLETVNNVLSLVDENGNAVAKIYEGSDGLKWIQTIDEGRTIGRITDAGVFEFSWKSDLDFARKSATKTVRKALVDFIQSGEHSDSEIRRLFPDITLEQIEYIREYGKIPEDIQIHHCYNVANYPDLAGDIRNLEVLSRENHLLAHGGSYQLPTNSRSVNYVDLVETLGIAA